MTHEASHPEFIWWNGERRHWDECTVHVTELGWSTVGAVFEGIRAYAGENDEMHVFRLREHLERLERSMRLVRCRWVLANPERENAHHEHRRNRCAPEDLTHPESDGEQRRGSEGSE